MPPVKRSGRATGRRRIDGELLDVAGGAAFLGLTEKAVWGRIQRERLPFRRLQGRVVLVRKELVRFIEKLPGVTVGAALANVARRPGGPAWLDPSPVDPSPPGR